MTAASGRGTATATGAGTATATGAGIAIVIGAAIGGASAAVTLLPPPAFALLLPLGASLKRVVLLGFSDSPPRRKRPSMFASEQTAEQAAQYSALGAAMAGGLGTAGMPGMLPNAGIMQMVDPNTKTLRELYVGNLPPGAMEFQLKEFLGQAIMQAELNTMPGSSVLQVRVSGKFAFAEFRSVEECNLAMNLKGAVWQNSVLDVKRPAKYNGPPTQFVSYGEYVTKNKPALFDQPGAVGLPEGGRGAAMMAGDVDTKMLRELYIGNVPPPMTEAQLQDFFNQQMKMRHLAKGPGNPCIQTRISNGFAFAEFRSVEETNLACAHLNNVEVMGAPLRVGRPKKYEDAVPLEQQQRTMRDAQSAQAAAATRIQDVTSCLQLSNMVTQDELSDESERKEIEQDIKMELSKFGAVESVALPLEGPGATKVYVKFTVATEARVARAALQGRRFSEKAIDVWFYEPTKFDAAEWEDMHATVCPSAPSPSSDHSVRLSIHVRAVGAGGGPDEHAPSAAAVQAPSRVQDG